VSAPGGAALVMRGVRKSYGRNVALDGLDLTIPRGVVSGLVGPNGAGKTTTYGIAGGFVVPDAGAIDLLGSGPFDPARHRGRITLLPQDCELNGHTPVRDLLVYFARVQGQTAGEAAKSADRVLDLVALQDRAGSRVRQLSHGMKRRVAVAQAFLGDPELVLLDEPTNGLDPELVVRMRDLFIGQRGRRTLVVSSHILAELEAACDHIAFLERGRCVKSGTIAEVTRRGVLLRVSVEAPVDLAAVAALLPDVVLRSEGSTILVTAAGADAASLNARVLPALLSAGARILEVRQGESLESAYLETRTKDSGPAPS
jgi:ABC-2 type transport system ATP-binding protein